MNHETLLAKKRDLRPPGHDSVSSSVDWGLKGIMGSSMSDPGVRSRSKICWSFLWTMKR